MNNGTKTGLLGMLSNWLLAVFAVALVTAPVVGLWMFSVATSDVKGRGDVHKTVNSAQNRLDWENKFANEAKAYGEEVKNIPGAKKAIKDWDAVNGKKDDSFGTLAQERQNLVSDLEGLRQQCHNNATAFNTDSGRTRVGAQFKGADQPDTLDDSACDA